MPTNERPTPEQMQRLDAMLARASAMATDLQERDEPAEETPTDDGAQESPPLTDDQMQAARILADRFNIDDDLAIELLATALLSTSVPDNASPKDIATRTAEEVRGMLLARRALGTTKKD